MMDMATITSGKHSTVPPPGLKLACDIISPDEETALIDLMEGMDVPRFALDPTNPRSKQAYGWDYLPDDTIVPCPMLPADFDKVRARAAELAGIAPDDLIQGMLSRYEPGSIIQWHVDKPVWEHVVGLSLGEPITMGFRKQVDEGWDVRAVELPTRSMYLMIGEARFLYQHGLPPAPGVRWSITFRSFSNEGRRLRDQVTATTE